MSLVSKSAAFAAAVAKAMNDAKIERQGNCCAVMTVVGDAEHLEILPCGFSINCNEQGVWEIMPDMLHSQPEWSI